MAPYQRWCTLHIGKCLFWLWCCTVTDVKFYKFSIKVAQGSWLLTLSYNTGGGGGGQDLGRFSKKLFQKLREIRKKSHNISALVCINRLLEKMYPPPKLYRVKSGQILEINYSQTHCLRERDSFHPPKPF